MRDGDWEGGTVRMGGGFLSGKWDRGATQNRRSKWAWVVAENSPTF